MTTTTVQVERETYDGLMELLANLAEGWASYDEEATPSKEAHDHFRAVRRGYKADAWMLLTKLGCRSQNADECSMIREREVAGYSNERAICPLHGEVIG